MLVEYNKNNLNIYNINMNKIIKFLEENNKWIVRILVFIWLALIIKLWWIWMYIEFHIFNWFLEYSRTNAWYISVIFFIISVILIFIISNTNNKTKKIQIAFIIFLLWLLWKPIFYFVSPDFKFYFTDEYKKYKTEDDKVLDIDLYLEYMWKYCNNSIDNFKFKRVFRADMCSWKYLYDFETVEEYAKVFDYANKNNMRELYRLTYSWAEKFWLEKIIEGYNDDTFYGYLLYRWELKKNMRKILSKFIINLNILNILEFYEDVIFKNQELLKNDNSYNSSQYWKNFDKILYYKLKQIPEINYKIF